MATMTIFQCAKRMFIPFVYFYTLFTLHSYSGMLLHFLLCFHETSVLLANVFKSYREKKQWAKKSLNKMRRLQKRHVKKQTNFTFLSYIRENSSLFH